MALQILTSEAEKLVGRCWNRINGHRDVLFNFTSCVKHTYKLELLLDAASAINAQIPELTKYRQDGVIMPGF